MSSSKPAGERAAASRTTRVLAALPRYLRTGVRSTRDVRSYLGRRGVSAGRAARLVAGYRARGWLDDRAAARLWADHWAREGYAASLIRAKLSAKGFSEDVIDETATRCCPPTDDQARARLLVATYLQRHAPPRRVRSLPAPAEGRQAGRLARTLASRGFDSDLIEQVLNESLGRE